MLLSCSRASSAHPIVLLGLRNKGAPVCSDPGQQSSPCPGTMGLGGVGINGGVERHRFVSLPIIPLLWAPAYIKEVRTSSRTHFE
ncbi:hypothetical protein NQZ68_008944 [Dissostichus eleginoides]|nr:hypothetical protein NQZ68_008944 [Dissostichus eleginoides]